MKKFKNTFVFAGGGTGGHIYPGLAVADELRLLASKNNQEIKIVWLGNSSGMDKNLVEKSGSVDEFIGIPSGKLRRYFSFKNFSDLFKIFAGLIKSFFTLLKLKPAVLFSKGGFVSVPPCVAAKLLRIPVFTHECDFTPGLATRLNSRFATKILVSYEETKTYLPSDKRDKAIVTGNPVRPVFYSTNPEEGKKFLFSERSDYNPEKPILLVLGGSLGAHQINELVAQNLDWLCERFNVVHQCGAKDADSMPKNHEGYFLHPFIYKEMSDVISAADIVLSRAGANSIWECSVLGKPMVLIPLCGSGTRGDQVDNAHFFEERGAAIVLLGEYAEESYLKSALEKMADSDFRENAALASKSLSEGKRPASKIAEIVWQASHAELASASAKQDYEK
ncbi:MAG: undecaprenyldiphospho-muramoylpentapeptide beta-N-acetylglucosaminyltransferase [Treponema sp.]|uniref:undecaprenyldiphospho-muramoylpentapeptide beta-N-acetylglucosaminyltransferase n=1 Tax=Treponema sp. TaxID=166 RepID=UPI002A917848|nr:undecaprenyldiphospho-muramoylpentapeptide beta-N-acetylglucosaminyltransferase [Treponema sp.]MDY6398691.1 undecaprenyldiphospho-muramoylpentapeptide beta-N-acetylglucosaminyltransferase [Treponema sp.]